MNEPQVWTALGIVGAAFTAMVTIVTTLFIAVVRSEIRGLRTELTTRLDTMDRDITALMRHTFGIDRE